jgi:hypothetical protein
LERSPKEVEKMKWMKLRNVRVRLRPEWTVAGVTLAMRNGAHVHLRTRLARTILCGVVGLLLVAASSALASDTTYPSLAGKWQLGEFTLGGGFAVRTAGPLPAEGVTFPFLDRPDTIFLVTENPAYKGRLLGDLTGETLAARFGVDVMPGTQFDYYGDPDGSGRPANVRLYFETDLSLGPIVCPCQDKGWSSFWYSNPARIDLQTLQSGDATLSVKLDPALWADGQETPGDADEAHRSSFAQAVAHVDHVGITFGGGRHFHNGVGIVPGTGSGSFRLFSYEAGR